MSIESLSEYRDRRQVARAYHPSAWQPVFDPRDAVAAAQRFHAELDHAERGALRPVGDQERAVTPPKVASKSLLFRVSRERKARWMDRIAVTLLMLLMAALGCIVLLSSAPHAKADVDNVVFAYTQVYGSAVCETLDDGHDSVDGLTGIMASIVGDGLTPYQAGQVVAISVTERCPQYTPLLRAYVARSKAAVA